MTVVDTSVMPVGSVSAMEQHSERGVSVIGWKMFVPGEEIQTLGLKKSVQVCHR